MSRSTIATTLEALQSAMNTPGIGDIEYTPAAGEPGGEQLLTNAGLMPVVADTAGRLWRVHGNTFTLIGNWKS